jgi:hypothetical protein
MGFVLSFQASTLVAQIENAEAAKLESWLIERKLDALLLEQLESRLESTFDSQERERIAGRLAELYSSRLLSSKDSSEKWLKRTRELIALYPKFETGRLRVAMLHARYLESENRFRSWFRDGANTGEKEPLESSLVELERDLVSATGALSERSEELFATKQMQRESDPILEQKLGIANAQLLHCHYLAGWTGYFLAILQPKNRTQLLELASFRFREFLRLDQAAPLQDYDSRWFDFSSSWQIRAMSGLASVEVARENYNSADHLFGLVEANAIGQSSREFVSRFRLLSYAYAGQFYKAKEVVSRFARRSDFSRDGKVAFYLTAADVARATPDKQLSASLRKAAHVGLARQMAGELLVAQLDNKKAEAGALRPDLIKSLTNFEDLWIEGYRQFWLAESDLEHGSENRSQRQRLAESLLSKAVSIGTATADPSNFEMRTTDVARCQYLLAWLALQSGDEDNAAAQFQSVAQTLARRDPVLAAESAWLAAKSLIRIGQQESNRSNEAWSQLERFLRQFPDSSHVAEAEFEKLKIELRAMPASEAIDRLREVSPANENYAKSLLETVRQRYRLWQANQTKQANQTATPDGVDVAFQKLAAARDQVEQWEQSTDEQKFRANLLVLDALLRRDGVSKDTFASELQRASGHVVKEAGESKFTLELDYYKFLLHQKNGETESAIETARRIFARGKGTRFELPALIAMATHLDAALSNAVSDQPLERPIVDSALLSESLSIYQRLSERLGDDASTLTASSNARVAFAKLGEIYWLAGNAVASAEVFQKLIGQFPGNARYLRAMALAKADLGSLDEAREIWQRLASGVDAGSELWFESKWRLGKIVAVTDRKSAATLLRQSIQLGGDVPENWKLIFEQSIDRYESGDGP